jgi:hypothetical protein
LRHYLIFQTEVFASEGIEAKVFCGVRAPFSGLSVAM